MMAWLRTPALAIDRFWFAKVDARIYAMLRIAFAIVALINLVDLWPDRHAFFADTGMIDLQATRHLGQNEMLLSVFFYATSESAVTAVFLITAVALISLAAGIFPRLCLLIGYGWLLSYTQRSPLILHGWDELLRITALLLLVSPIGKCWRLPTYMKRRLQGDQHAMLWNDRERVPRYGLVLIQLQLCVVYWQTLWLKLADEHWLNGDFLPYFMLSMYSKFPDTGWASWHLLGCFLTYSTLFCELLIPVFLWFKRTRWLGFLLGLGLHLGILVASTLWLFSLVILILYPAFLDDDNMDWMQRRFEFSRDGWQTGV